MKKKLIIAFIFLIILISFVFIIWKYYGTNKRTEELISTKVQKGTFNISIISTGEIEAKSSVYIYGPAELKNYGIYQYKISDLIAEGTFVKQGDYVASIDKTEISDKLKALQSELEKLQSQLEKNKIDTSLELRNERDKLSGLKFAVRESKVNLDQSKYEPPAVIRQAEIEYEKSKRTLEQAEKNYSLKKEQINNKITENINTIAQTQLKIDDLQKLSYLCTIKAPKTGILVHKYERNGEKISVGSVVSVWNNIIAILPDLSQLISKTYINEIDINKIQTGMKAEISLDALPNKKYFGKIIYIANLGEIINNSPLKMFEVKILIETVDNIIKPSMSSRNTLFINSIPDAIFVPLECVHNQDDIDYVYKATDTGIIKQEVKQGEENSNFVIIYKGLNPDDIVYLSIPENNETININRLKN